MPARSIGHVFSALAALVLAAQAQAQLATSYQSRLLSPLPFASRSFVSDIGPTGVVVGSTLVPVLSIPRQSERSVYWPAGSSSPRSLSCLSARLPSPSATPCMAQAINAQGRLAGWSASGTFTTKRAVLWSAVAGAPTDLSADLNTAGLTGSSSWAIDLNDQGQVLGAAASSGLFELRPFVWQDGRVRVMPLPAADLSQIRPVGLDEHGVAAISALRRIGPSAQATYDYRDVTLLWHPDQRLEEVPDLTPLGVGPAGHVVGRYQAPGQPLQAAVWFQGQLQLLPTDAGLTSEARAVNRQGVVVGTHANPGHTAPSQRAVVWSQGLRRDAAALTTPPAGYHLDRGIDINDAGVIVVEGSTATRVQSVVLTPRP